MAPEASCYNTLTSERLEKSLAYLHGQKRRGKRANVSSAARDWFVDPSKLRRRFWVLQQEKRVLRQTRSSQIYRRPLLSRLYGGATSPASPYAIALFLPLHITSLKRHTAKNEVLHQKEVQGSSSFEHRHLRKALQHVKSSRIRELIMC